MDDLWIVVPVGKRETYLNGLLSKLSSFGNRLILINNHAGYTRFESVTQLEDFGDISIYRWWNKGIRYAKDNGAKYVLVLNDDVDFDDSFIQEMLDVLIKGNLAIVDVENSGNGGGAAWIMDLSYNLFLDENFCWWYGDTELFDRAKKLGKFKRHSTRSEFTHFSPNLLMSESQGLQKAIYEDANLYNRLTDLKNVYSKYSNVFGSGGGDKGTAHDYLGTYARYMENRINISILEIGVFRGESLKVWQEYFVDSFVMGIDINLQNLVYSDVQAFLCDATSGANVDSVVGDRQFDYIVDDGSHLPEHQIASFEIFYPRLKSGGKYFIEDILGDDALARLIGYFENSGIRYRLADTRRPETTYNDLILIIGRE